MARLAAARNARNTLILSNIGHFGAHVFELMVPTLAVTLASRTNMPLDTVLAWSFRGYLLFGLGALPAALMSERVSPRLLLITALFGLGVASLAASEAPNGRVLSLCLAAMGASAGILQPAGASLAARAVDSTARARRVAAGCADVAVALTPLTTAALCAQLGWQPTFRVAGYALCAVAVACGFLRLDERRVADRAAEDHAPRRVAVPLLAVLLGAGVLAAIAYRAVTVVLPGYFASNVSAIGFGAATSLAYGLGIAGRHAGRRVAERGDPRRYYLAFTAIGVLALLCIAALSGVALVGAGALFVFCSLGLRPLEQRLLAQYARSSGLAVQAQVTLTTAAGALGVWLVGWAGAAGGLSYALLCAVVVMAAATAAAAVLVTVDGRGAVHHLPGYRRAVGAAVALDAAAASSEPRPSERIGIP